MVSVEFGLGELRTLAVGFHEEEYKTGVPPAYRFVLLWGEVCDGSCAVGGGMGLGLKSCGGIGGSRIRNTYHGGRWGRFVVWGGGSAVVKAERVGDVRLWCWGGCCMRGAPQLRVGAAWVTAGAHPPRAVARIAQISGVRETDEDFADAARVHA